MPPSRTNANQSRTQVRGSVLLLAGRLLALLINLAVQVLLVRYLAKAEFGSLSFALSLVASGANLSLLGMNKTVSRFSSLYHEQQDYSRLAGTSVLVMGSVSGMSLLFLLAVIAGQYWYGRALLPDQLAGSLTLVLIVLVPVEALDQVFQAHFSVFAKTSAVFLRRHVLGPSFKLLSVAAVVIGGWSVQTLAVLYVLAGLLGLLLYVTLLKQILAAQDLGRYFRPGMWRIPAGELFRYSWPLYFSQAGFLFRGPFIILLLGVLQASDAVAEYKAVQPFARLNLVVLQSFTFLFIPLASRMLARDDRREINELYWNSAAWVSVLTFPLLLTTGVFGRQFTTWLLGTEYAQASAILAILAIGFFLEAAAGFSEQTLRVYAKVRCLMLADLATAATALMGCLILIPAHGPLGAAIAASGSMALRSLLHVAAMRRYTDVGIIGRRHALVYLWMIAVGSGLWWLQRWYLLPLPMCVVAIATVSLLTLLVHREALQTETVFPELRRLPLVGRLLVREG